MRCFSFTEKLSVGQIVSLDVDESRHIIQVLRLKIGEFLELRNTTGKKFLAEITSTQEQVNVKVLKELEIDEISGSIMVGQALLKLKKIELILQKCTELGVGSIQPFLAQHSQGNLLKQYSGKGDRFRRIIEESCKQCERGPSMSLHGISEFNDFFTKENENGSLRLLFWEKEKSIHLQDLRDMIRPDRPIILAFGPEGGFTEKEIDHAREVGWQTVGLGQRILRAETAVIAATSIVQHYLGNM